ncbi:type I restriction enzyme S subunit [Parabacteroides sp. PFB2-12]|uniref:restriction endonuclease subunit S n=1 Tax=unclassified Parabacteroides TaxID=2649774 RepID=UPI002475349E|nr:MULTISPECIES: restriction endonuclease subunit S [unclassified Parabacteroides]MDH6343799.1 type I restriction enzyme S subunit [Parabacteroides sp. PM6-13]MDH6391961.1 type I restriction enzyme S subunit [Parabacteroides sp. PFB2-12]
MSKAYIPFNTVIDDVTKLAKKIEKSNYLTIGKYPIVDQGKSNIAGYAQDKDGLYENTPAIIFGDHTRIIKYVDVPCFIGADGVKLLKIKSTYAKDFDYKFLYYYLSSQNIPDTGYNRHFKWLKAINIYKPSICLQHQIAATLDKASELIALCKKQLEELDALAESVFYDMFKNAKTEIKELWQVLDVQNGLVDPTVQPYSNMIHVGGANIESNSGNIVNVKLAKEENLISGKYYFNETMVLYSKIRPNLNKVALPLQEGICSADMYPLIPKSDKINRVFLRYILIQSDFLEYAISHSGRANIPKINRKDLLRYKLSLPPFPLQTRFATIIEKIDQQKSLVKKALQESEDLFQRLMQNLFKPD